MFSKKDNKSLAVFLDEDRRAFFRVEPPSKERLLVRIEQCQYRVKNISAGGIAIFRTSSESQLEIGKMYPFHMILPILNEDISGTLRVVNRSEQGFHCEFIVLSDEKREQLHLFVLELQKEQLKERKESE